MPLIKADSERIANLLDRFAAISATPPDEGVTRLAFSRLEREAHKIFVAELEALGLRVWQDSVGNTIAEKAGTLAGVPALGTGSHLDSVPNGGRYDGIVGVVGAMEAARIIVESGVRNRRPLRFVAFAAEEGARFGQACLGSRSVTGLTTPADLARLRDKDGMSAAEALAEIGLDAERVVDDRWTAEQWGCFVELHVEQGSVLATEGLGIGVVSTISGSTRLSVELVGTASHSGGTPMGLRADALTCACEIVLLGERLAREAGEAGTRVTSGRLEVEPGSITTIPGRCRVSFDVRDTDPRQQAAVTDELVAGAHRIAEERGIGIEVTRLAHAEPVALPPWLSDVLGRTCAELGVDHRVMSSGASHDTQMVNSVCPGGMVFVPSHAHGVSHAPEESSDPAEIAVGVDVLTRSLLALDEDAVWPGGNGPRSAAAAGQP